MIRRKAKTVSSKSPNCSPSRLSPLALRPLRAARSPCGPLTTPTTASTSCCLPPSTTPTTPTTPLLFLLLFPPITMFIYLLLLLLRLRSGTLTREHDDDASQLRGGHRCPNGCRPTPAGSRCLWVFISGGCSGRGVQWIGVASCSKIVYMTPFKSLHPVSTAPLFAECRAWAPRRARPTKHLQRKT